MLAIDKEESLCCFMKSSLLKTGAMEALWPADLFPVDTGSQHYLDTHNASSPTAVLALGHSLIAVAQGIKSQNSSNTVPHQADLKKATEAGEEEKKAP